MAVDRGEGREGRQEGGSVRVGVFLCGKGEGLERERGCMGGGKHMERRANTLTCTCTGSATQVMRGAVRTKRREAARNMTRNNEEGG